MQERVADYPRPPRLERDPRRVRIVFAGVTIADTEAAWRVLETYHPPSFYLPADAFLPASLVETRRTSLCEWKGRATYFSVQAAGKVAANAAWAYPDPDPAFAAIAGHVAVYAGNGQIYSNDAVTPGQVSKVAWDLPEKRWGQHFEGWSAPYFPRAGGSVS